MIKHGILAENSEYQIKTDLSEESAGRVQLSSEECEWNQLLSALSDETGSMNFIIQVDVRKVGREFWLDVNGRSAKH